MFSRFRFVFSSVLAIVVTASSSSAFSSSKLASARKESQVKFITLDMMQEEAGVLYQALSGKKGAKTLTICANENATAVMYHQFICRRFELNGGGNDYACYTKIDLARGKSRSFTQDEFEMIFNCQPSDTIIGVGSGEDLDLLGGDGSSAGTSAQ